MSLALHVIGTARRHSGDRVNPHMSKLTRQVSCAKATALALLASVALTLTACSDGPSVTGTVGSNGPGVQATASSGGWSASANVASGGSTYTGSYTDGKSYKVDASYNTNGDKYELKVTVTDIAAAATKLVNAVAAIFGGG